MEKELNLPTLCLVSYVIKTLILGANISDAIVIITLSCLYVGYKYLEEHKPKPQNEETLAKFEELENQIKLVKDKVNSVTLGINLKR